MLLLGREMLRLPFPSRVADAADIISFCVYENVRRAHRSEYGHAQCPYASGHARADGCADGCEWNGHVSVYGYAYGDAHASLSCCLLIEQFI